MPLDSSESPTIEELESIVDEGSDQSIAELLREEYKAEETKAEPVKEVVEEEAATDKEPDTKEPDAKDKAEPEDKAEEIEPPAEWSAEEHAKFRKLDTDSRKWVLDRVGSAEKATKEAQEASQKYSAIEDAISGSRDQWARDGMTEPVAIKQLIALSDFAAQKPVDFIQWFAQQRGIDLGQKQQAQPEQTQDQYVDPEMQALLNEIQTLKGELGHIRGTTEKLTGSLTERQQQEQIAAEQQNMTVIQEFQSQTNDDGSIAHPYFEQVKVEMGLYLEKGLAKDLQDAYDRACRANPDVSAKIEQSHQAKVAQEQAKKDREKAAAARKTGSSVSGSPGARSEPSMTGDLRDDLRSEFATRGLV